MFNLLKVLVLISNILPSRIRIFLADKIVNKTVDKYASIELINESVIRKRRGLASVYISNHLSERVTLNYFLRTIKNNQNKSLQWKVLQTTNSII